MADILPHLLIFPPDKVLPPKKYDEEIREFIKQMGKISTSQWTKIVDKDKSSTLLDVLDPAVNTIPYLAALPEHINKFGSGKDKARLEALFDKVMLFLTSFDPVQVRYLGEHWKSIFEWACDTCHKTGVMQLQFLSTALLRLDPTAGTFTSSHLYFLQLCLAQGVPSQALPIIDKIIYAFPQTPPKSVGEELLSEEHDLSNAYITAKSGFSAKITPEMVLEYYLLGAHAYIGLRDYSRARLYLETVMLYPASGHTTSALQVEAYKKFVLVGLLAEGKQWPQAKTIDQAVLKNLRALSKAYESLADSFEKRKWRKFHAETDAGGSSWLEDGNLRLVKEVGDALQRFRVIDLQKTYAALPVSRVALHLGFAPDFTANLLTDMINANHLNATITPGGSSAGDSVLRFNPATTASTTATTTQDDALQGQTARIEALVTYIRDADRRLQLSKEYIDYAKKQKKMGASVGAAEDLADQMDLSWDPTIGGGGSGGNMAEDEEDIMAV